MSYPHDSKIKAEIIKRLRAGEKAPALSRETGIPERTIRGWKPAEQDGGHHAAVIKTSGCVMAIPDMHHPFCHPHALEFLKAVRDKYHPSEYVCLGDEVDFHALSRYDHDPNGLSAGGELKAAIDALIPFYLEFPQMKVCESNHTVRGHKTAYSAGLPSAFLNHIATVLNAPDGWKWANHWEIDGVRYFHGDAGRSGQYAHMAYLKMFKQNLVIGHIHSFAGVNFEGHHWAANSGCLIDETKYAFAYAKNMPIKPNLGCTLIYGGKWAHFIPMTTDSNGMWTGEL